MQTIKKLKSMVIDCETTGLDTFNDKLLGLSYAHEDGGSIVTGWLNDIEEIKAFLIEHKETHLFVAQNGKFDAKFIYNTTGVLVDIAFDTKLAYSLLHIDRESNLETIVDEVFDVHKEDLIEIYNAETGKNRKSFPDDFHQVIPMHKIIKYAQEDAFWEHKLMDYCIEEFEKNEVIKDWFYKVENPLGNILTLSELDGVKLDIPKLCELQKTLALRLINIHTDIVWLSGNKDLNINSSKQLQEFLYVTLGLKSGKKTKSGAASTDSSTLERLKHKHAAVKLILEHKELTKLMTTFIEPLISKSDAKGRIHASFNQLGTKTRRFSCQNPNLQQIPAKSDLGKVVRSCFIPEEGYKFLVVDYSQIELRILAHFSKDAMLKKAFFDELDLHTFTASLMNEIPFDEVTKEQRAIGKLLNFSLLYGKTSFGFAQDWNVSEKEAQVQIDKWFNSYTGVKQYIKDQELYARSHSGWIKSLSGLPLYVQNVNSSNRYKFDSAMRQAVNFPIQASSQDILKKSVVDIYNNLGLHPLLLVHDELVFELKDDSSLDITVQDVLLLMESAWKLEVPLKVSHEVASYWTK